MKEQFPKSIFLHDGQTEISWSDSEEVGGVKYVRSDVYDGLVDALQCMLDESAHLAGFSINTERKVVEVMYEAKQGLL
jgi:hypothetical protein